MSSLVACTSLEKGYKVSLGGTCNALLIDTSFMDYSQENVALYRDKQSRIAQIMILELAPTKGAE